MSVKSDFIDAFGPKLTEKQIKALARVIIESSSLTWKHCFQALEDIYPGLKICSKANGIVITMPPKRVTEAQQRIGSNIFVFDAVFENNRLVDVTVLRIEAMGVGMVRDDFKCPVFLDNYLQGYLIDNLATLFCLREAAS